MNTFNISNSRMKKSRRIQFTFNFVAFDRARARPRKHSSTSGRSKSVGLDSIPFNVIRTRCSKINLHDCSLADNALMLQQLIYREHIFHGECNVITLIRATWREIFYWKHIALFPKYRRNDDLRPNFSFAQCDNAQFVD